MILLCTQQGGSCLVLEWVTEFLCGFLVFGLYEGNDDCGSSMGDVGPARLLDLLDP